MHEKRVFLNYINYILTAKIIIDLILEFDSKDFPIQTAKEEDTTLNRNSYESY